MISLFNPATPESEDGCLFSVLIDVQGLLPVDLMVWRLLKLGLVDADEREGSKFNAEELLNVVDC